MDFGILSCVPGTRFPRNPKTLGFWNFRLRSRNRISPKKGQWHFGGFGRVSGTKTSPTSQNIGILEIFGRVSGTKFLQNVNFLTFWIFLVAFQEQNFPKMWISSLSGFFGRVSGTKFPRNVNSLTFWISLVAFQEQKF